MTPNQSHSVPEEAESKRGEMLQWQPIETLPEGEQHFLAHVIDEVDEYDEAGNLVARAKKEPCIIVAQRFLGGQIIQIPWNGGLPRGRRFTHWMPLPAPPAALKDISHD